MVLATDKIQTDKKSAILGKLIKKLIKFESEKKTDNTTH